MHITTITYQRVVNLGRYESARLDASAELEPDEDPHGAYLNLRDWVHTQLGLPARSEPMTQAEANPPVTVDEEELPY